MAHSIGATDTPSLITPGKPFDYLRNALGVLYKLCQPAITSHSIHKSDLGLSNSLINRNRTACVNESAFRIRTGYIPSQGPEGPRSLGGFGGLLFPQWRGGRRGPLVVSIKCGSFTSGGSSFISGSHQRRFDLRTR
ncbi:hypothetical protein BJY01DRAFT_210604 [Aspergillus pseudoustus]|uniref:Uncharacterized protein n=1 Tax=Aspergillus pseudoustus TaxID=1810923 RepID=A0ABR4KDQ4_9EURO